MNASRAPAPFCALVLAALASIASASDWPQWRGPLGDGTTSEQNLPTQWGEESVAWSAPLSGLGVSSPIVSGERVFVTSQAGRSVRRPGRHPLLARDDPAVAASERPLADPRNEAGDVELVVEALHRSDGRALWQFRTKADGELPPVHEKHNLASPSPVTDGKTVFAWFGNGQPFALAADDGVLLWQRHLGQEIGPFQLNWGHGSSPALHNELLYLLCFHEPASYLLAVDKSTGETRWRIDREAGVRSYSTPLVIDGPVGEELIVNSTEGVHAYDPASGELLWHAGGEHRFAIPVPSYHDGVLYTSRGYRSGPYLAVRPGARGGADVGASHVLWQVATGAPYISSLLFADGLLYMASDSGVLTCIDAKNGERVWRERTGGIFSASPVAGDGRLYLMSETGETIVYALGREPRVLARNRIEGRVVASPAIAGGRIFVRTDDRLVAIGAPSGAD